MYGDGMRERERVGCDVDKRREALGEVDEVSVGERKGEETEEDSGKL